MFTFPEEEEHGSKQQADNAKKACADGWVAGVVVGVVSVATIGVGCVAYFFCGKKTAFEPGAPDPEK